jgi:Ca-activated chloride channel family protein
MVPIELSLQALDAKGEVPRTLQAKDLTVQDGDQIRPVTDLAPLTKPWRIVVYVDRVLTGSRTLRTAAGSLAERAAILSALGPVEVVVAEPIPRVVLSATQDVHAIDEALSKLWLVGDGRDDIRVLRQRFRDQKKDEGVAADPAGEAIDEEERLVRRQQDALAEWLVAQEGGGPRALLLVSDGFDVDPEKYYRPDAAPSGAADTATPAREGALEKTGLETARTAAALGWTVFPLPMGDSSLPDLRHLKANPTPKVPLGGKITFGRAKPEEPANQPPPAPELLAPQEPLKWLAETTGGELVVGPGSLAAALTHLRSRFWVRYQAIREMDGRPHAVEVRTSRSDLAIKGRRWDVEGVPEAVAAARAGRLLNGEDDGVGLEISARIQPAPADTGKGMLDLRIESPEPSASPLRVTVAGAAGRGATHHILTPADLAGTEANVYRLPVSIPDGADAVGVEIEPVAGGAWGGQVVNLGAALPEPAALTVGRPGIRLIAPTGSSLSSKVKLRVNGDGKGIARVDLRLGDRTAASCTTVPCEVEVDLGRRVRQQILQGIAYDAAGKEVARDAVRLNDPAEGFDVRIVEPASRRGVGAVDVEAEVRAPAGRRLEKLEFFWNDELAGTVYAPPFRHRVIIPKDRPVGFLKISARLDDGSTAEDAMSLNTSDIGDRIVVRLIQLAVVVTDANGKPVPGLPKEAFRLRQNGEPQEIAAFENAGELPITVALAIDSSASMFLKLPDVRRAVASLLETGLSNRDRAMLIAFDDTSKLIRPVTRDLSAVSASLSTLTPDGGTALWEAISYSLVQLRGISGRKALVLYTDGIDQSERERLSYGECLRVARESGIPIYMIVANPRAARGEDGGFLTEPTSAKFKRLADAGGGQVYFIEPEQDLAEVYGQILSELRSQYTLAFYPKESAPPAAWSKIDVDVLGHKGLTARTVSGVPGH